MAPRKHLVAAAGRRSAATLALLGALAGANLSLAGSLDAAKKAVRMQDYAQAYELYAAEADDGHAEAQYQLALLLLRGPGNLQKRPARARQWLERAAEQDHAGARYSLAMQLADTDPQRAERLLQAAADQGYRAARSQLQRLQSTIEDNDPETPLEQQWFGAARNDNVAQLESLRAKGVDLETTNDSGRSALFTAVQHGSSEALSWLLDRGIDVNRRDQFGLSAAQTAVERAQLGALKKLLAAGADKTQRFKNGDNLLHYAVRKERLQTARYLIAQGVSLNQQNKEGWTPLDLAEYHKQPRFVAALRDAGARHGSGWRQQRRAVDVEQLARQLKAQDDVNAVAHAISNSQEALLHQLLEQQPERVDAALDDGNTPLMMAIKQDKTGIVGILLTHNADVNAGAFRGATPLQLAVRDNRRTIAEQLLAAGADPLKEDDAGMDAIATAIDFGHQPLALTLLDHVLAGAQDDRAARGVVQAHNVPVDTYLVKATKEDLPALTERLLPILGNSSATDELGRNALWFAARAKDAALVEKLLDAGVDPTQRDNLGLTPFLVAVENSCMECARLLLPANDIDQQSDTGNTALMLAAQNADPLLTAWLVQNNADVEIRNQRGNTAIMEAVNSGSRRVVRLLLKADANVTRKNKLGFSAIDLAKQVGPEMETLVKSQSVLGIF